MTPPQEIIRTPGGVYVLKNDTHLSRWIELHGTLEVGIQAISLYAKYIPKGGTVVDAGACLGDHAATYAQMVGPEGAVWAFEPYPEAYYALTRNTRMWPQVETRPFGLSDFQEPAFFVVEDNAGASHISVPGDRSIMVWVTRLDNFLEDLTRLDLIHLDCEGFEPRAIMGATETIKKFKPAMVIEINHACLGRYGMTQGDVYSLLDSIGYGYTELEPGRGPADAQRDILCLPK